MTETPLNLYGSVEDQTDQNLANRYSLKLLSLSAAPQEPHLRSADSRLAIYCEIFGYFQLELRQVNKRLKRIADSPLGKACNVRNRPNVLDALGGWGTDALVLSMAGCQVTHCEVSQLISLLCQDRARLLDHAINFHTVDVQEFMNDTEEQFDVVYLDPMFPAHPKGALPSKSLQVLSMLAPETEIRTLFDRALTVASERVVVKQRRKQSSLLPKPDWVLKGRAIRFDVYRTHTK